MTRSFAFRPACVLLVAAALAPPVFAQVSVTRATPPESAVDAVFKRYDSKDSPGCSVAVMDDGKVLLKKSYGMADPSLGVARTSATSHWIPYSEARVFVALAVAMLARNGKVSWDEPIRKHVPEVPAYASTVTIQQLLHHTSGLPDYGVLGGPGAQVEDRVSEDELFRLLQQWNKLGFAPGTDMMYSNTDYALLKMLVERVTGGSLQEYLHAEVLERLGMSSTRIGAEQEEVFPGHSLFHIVTSTGVRRGLKYRTDPVGQIAVTTSLDDLVRWQQALDANSLGLRDMLSSLEIGAKAHMSDGGRQGVPFGIYRLTHKGLPVVAYQGVGGYTYLVQVPGTGLGVATLCNVYPRMDSMGLDVARLYAAPPAWTEPPARTVGPAVNLPEAELRRYVGEYRSSNERFAMHVARKGGQLEASSRSWPTPSLWAAHGNGKFTDASDGLTYLMEFKEDDSGRMTLSAWDLTNDSSGGESLRRVKPWVPQTETLHGYAGTYSGDNSDVVLYVRSDGKQVFISTRGLAESSIIPRETPDHFAGPDVYNTRFERDASGRVVALILDATRVKGMRYTRQ